MRAGLPVASQLDSCLAPKIPRCFRDNNHHAFLGWDVSSGLEGEAAAARGVVARPEKRHTGHIAEGIHCDGGGNDDYKTDD